MQIRICSASTTGFGLLLASPVEVVLNATAAFAAAAAAAVAAAVAAAAANRMQGVELQMSKTNDGIREDGAQLRPTEY